MNISVFLGAPGSGKGTQAKRLMQAQGFQHLSTGDILRAAIAAGTDVGKKAKSFIDKGDLVPDGVMIELIRVALSPLSPDSRIILDGFPRTVAQAEALDNDPKTRVSKAIYFKIPESVLVDRLTGRRVCAKCGEPYHIHFMPPKKASVCDKCGGELLQRSDDREDVVKRRLSVFQQSNGPLLEYYSKSSRQVQLDADRDVEKVQTELGALLK